MFNGMPWIVFFKLFIKSLIPIMMHVAAQLTPQRLDEVESYLLNMLNERSRKRKQPA